MTGLYQFAPKALGLLDAERAHDITIRALQMGFGPHKTAKPATSLAINFAGLNWPGPVGLAAGFDKNANVPNQMLKLGFGGVECGSVTPLAQAGNPKPRLFRLPKDKAVINRLGFNNHGLEKFAENLIAALQKNPNAMIGANIGANKNAKDRAEDYCAGLRALWGLPAWFTINISSPNTPGLRDLQGLGALNDLLGRIETTRSKLPKLEKPCPVFLKVAPDLDEQAIEDICKSAMQYKMDGVILTNTTLARPDSLSSRYRHESGGLSGAPLFGPSLQVLKLFRQASKGKIPLIGVGGISTPEHVWQKLKAGASAVQLYSALVYEGPNLAAKMHRELAQKMKIEGIAKLSEIVGVDQSL